MLGILECLYTCGFVVWSTNKYRAGILLKIQGTFYHILSWHKPALTLSVLGIFTYTCLYPQLILCSPIIFLLAGIMAPGFDKRHPRSADNLPTKFYRRDLLEAEAEEFEVQELVETQNQRKREERERALVARIRDLQNFLGALVSAIDALEEFIHGIGSFKHESKATALYLVLLMTLISVVYVASFIPPSIAICGSTWIAVSLCHPLLQKKAKKTNNKYWKSRNRRSVADWFKEFQADDIIIDEPPEEREVEIFELQRQGLTPRQWTPWVFTPVVYELMSPLRMSMSRPPGTRFLSDVQPPEGWFFYEEDEVDNDGNDASWAIDPKVKDWVSHRGLRCLELDLDSAWAYDYLDEERGEWRRRRWLRKCYRHVATS